IFPVPLERTTSLQPGARNGPSAILAASRGMELYDEELETEPYKEIGIHTLPPIDTTDGGLGEVITELYTAAVGLLDDNKFPVGLGGEHALTPPLVSAVARKYKSLNVLHIGAHAELRHEYQGYAASPACTMRRVVETCPAVQVGIRSISALEGSHVSMGQEIAAIAPDTEQVWEALRALYLIGQPQDIAAILPYERELPDISDRVRQQAAETERAIRARQK
ncbi:MAG: arginase family protein, partial [Acidobacteriia bacterium]|nr:arginase family protein [Terriglobia bacterium]